MTRRRPRQERATATPTADLRIVKQGATLLWPEGFEERYRARHPYVVDMSAPLERDEFCSGQDHKLRELTKDEARKYRKATPLEGDDSPAGRSVWAAISKVRTATKSGASGPEPKPVTDTLDERADAAAAEVADLDIPEPDAVEVTAEEDEA